MAQSPNPRWQHGHPPRYIQCPCDRLRSLTTYASPNILFLALGLTRNTEDRSSTAFKLNLAASILLPSIVPFTIAFIVPVNNKLIEKMNSLASSSLDDKAVEAGVAEGETTHALIDRWATLNLARAALVAAGSLCTVLAVVGA